MFLYHQQVICWSYNSKLPSCWRGLDTCLLVCQQSHRNLPGCHYPLQDRNWKWFHHRYLAQGLLRNPHKSIHQPSTERDIIQAWIHSLTKATCPCTWIECPNCCSWWSSPRNWFECWWWWPGCWRGKTMSNLTDFLRARKEGNVTRRFFLFWWGACHNWFYASEINVLAISGEKNVCQRVVLQIVTHVVPCVSLHQLLLMMVHCSSKCERTLRVIYNY